MGKGRRMLELFWWRNDFWTWLFLHLLWPVYLGWALYLYFKKRRLKQSLTELDIFRVGFWSLLALVGLLCVFRPNRPPIPEQSGRLNRSKTAGVGAKRRWSFFHSLRFD
jgi:hypothetical protein